MGTPAKVARVIALLKNDCRTGKKTGNKPEFKPKPLPRYKCKNHHCGAEFDGGPCGAGHCPECGADDVELIAANSK